MFVVSAMLSPKAFSRPAPPEMTAHAPVATVVMFSRFSIVRCQLVAIPWVAELCSLFSCRKDAWLSFNPRFRGFGGEEGYIHEKFRRAGRRCLCLPALRWMHRFSRPGGVPYRLTVEDKLRNYLIGHAELGMDIAPVLRHFADFLPSETIVATVLDALWETPLPATAAE